ncbi:hypothetical protein O7627_26400 [Solwaraspora sp. WMMD1047]|uniref:ATP-binding protein n=1 Tax=Solwaraspora sp. WMMD1047 TaxID=3016102 RepID=UPI002416CB7E|nr:ATP-binding protein [Solwaraspora sp. WMMD1047]MDG4832810.1 hypothetical protein [Solwaraspora sp. WMMD1047]
MSPMRCHVARHPAHTEVRLVGALDPSAAATVRRVLLSCLADRPDALIADLGQLRCETPAALSVLTEAATQAARWPQIPVLVYGAAPDAAAWLAPRLAVCATRAQALARIGTAPTRPSRCEDLLPVVGAARRARELTTEVCLRWRVPEPLVGPACVVVTELVANATVHAGTMMTLLLSSSDDRLQIALRDGSPALPVLNPPAPLAQASGRGLLLVDALGSGWGTLPVTGGGKLVWAVLDLAVDERRQPG